MMSNTLQTRYNIKEEAWRFDAIQSLQKAFPEFSDFCGTVMGEVYGFPITPLQADIAMFMQYGERLRMITAQRGEGKSQITSLYAIWRWVHNPAEIIILFGGTKEAAQELVTGISQVLFTWEPIKCLRPGVYDRSGATTLDIHGILKGPNKSPSLNALGILGRIQGKRAHVVISDDIEQAADIGSVVYREKLFAASQELASINVDGDIIFLGTPQSTESLYNSLPGRGYQVRVWPGRVPSEKGVEAYGDTLAPFIKAMWDNPVNRTGYGVRGDRGLCTDPGRLDEDAHQTKELDQTEAWYNLQYLLDTTLMDKGRFPLKSSLMVVSELDRKKCPNEIVVSNTAQTKISETWAVDMELYRPISSSTSSVEWESKIVVIDPSGGGATADDFVCVAAYQRGTYIYIAGLLALQGGATMENIEQCARFIGEHKVSESYVETNYGGNAVPSMLQMALKDNFIQCGVESFSNTAMKEQRIVGTLLPVMNQRRLIFSELMLEADYHRSKSFPGSEQRIRRLLHQITKIEPVKDSLRHDDACDCVAMAVERLVDRTKRNEIKTVEQVASEAILNMLKSHGAFPDAKPKSNYRSF